jgi:hypothetical protein
MEQRAQRFLAIGKQGRRPPCKSVKKSPPRLSRLSSSRDTVSDVVRIDLESNKNKPRGCANMRPVWIKPRERAAGTEGQIEARG